jgi:hypothetical protein
MKWLKVAIFSVLALWLAWDALDGLHFYSVQRDLGRKLEGRAAQALEKNDQEALHICIAQNASVERAFAVEILAALSVAFFAVRVGRARRAVANR